jgi:hypothetical protein
LYLCQHPTAGDILMKIFKLIIVITLFVAAPCFATDYDAYIADDGSACAGGGCTVGTSCQSGSPCIFSDIDNLIDDFSASGNTLTIYLMDDDTYQPTDTSSFIVIDKENITLIRSGDGTNKPIIDGQSTYPSHMNPDPVRPNGKAVSIESGNTEVNGIEFKDIYGQGIELSGSIDGSGQVRIKNCKFDGTGWAAIQLLGENNSSCLEATACVIENCEFTDINTYCKDEEWTSKWPQAVNGNSGYTVGHFIRNCKFSNIYGEGIGATGFRLVEYNVISGTKSGAIYLGYVRGQTMTNEVRYNLIWGDSLGDHSTGTMLTLQSENDSVDLTGVTRLIYGNVVVGGAVGMRMRNLDTGSHWGPIKVYNNTFVDCVSNFSFSQIDEFNDVEIKNNTSIIHSDASSSCVHITAYGNDWSNWDISNNHWDGGGWTEESDIVNYDDAALTAWRNDNVFGGSSLGKTSGWRSLTSCPSLDDFTPQAESDMIDNPGAADLGDSYDEYIISGEFSDLPDDPDFTLADQDTYGDEWDFGAIIKSGSSTPVLSALGPSGDIACNTDPQSYTQTVTTDIAATCKWDTSDTTYDLMSNTYTTVDDLYHYDEQSDDCGNGDTHYTICRNKNDSDAESDSSSNTWSINSPPFPGTLAGGGVIAIGSGSFVDLSSAGDGKIGLE